MLDPVLLMVLFSMWWCHGSPSLATRFIGIGIRSSVPDSLTIVDPPDPIPPLCMPLLLLQLAVVIIEPRLTMPEWIWILMLLLVASLFIPIVLCRWLCRRCGG